MGIEEQGLSLLRKNTFVYSSKYLVPVKNRYLDLYISPKEDGKNHIDDIPTTMFSAEISNRMSFSNILKIIKEPMDVLLGELQKEIDDYNRIFLLGSRAFNYNYLSKVKGSGLEKISIQEGNYDILHVTNKALYKSRILDNVVSKFVALQIKLHNQYMIPTVLRLINHGDARLRDELCLYPGCTGIMLDMVGWNSDQEINTLDQEDKKRGILSDEDQFESLLFFNSILVDNPKRFDEILVNTSPLPMLNELGVNLFFRIIGERVYKSFPVDTFRKQILDRQVTDPLRYSVHMFELYNALLYNVNVPGYEKQRLVRNIIDVLVPNLVDSYIESVVEFFRGHVNYMARRIHTRFETELMDNAFIILTGGDAFSRYMRNPSKSQDYDYKVVCQASKPGTKGADFFKLPGSNEELVTKCYRVITDELVNFMWSMNRLIESKNINIKPIDQKLSNIDTYLSVKIHSTFYNPNVVNFRMRKGDKNKTRIYSVDFRAHMIFEYSKKGIKIYEKIPIDIPLIDIGIIDAFDFDSTKSVGELKKLHQHSAGPIASPYFLLSDIYKTYKVPSMYKTRYKKMSKDRNRIEQLIGSVSKLPTYQTLDLSKLNYNTNLDKLDTYTLPESRITKHYKRNVVFDNTFKKKFEKEEWDKSWKKDSRWVNETLSQAKAQFASWAAWEKVRYSEEPKLRHLESIQLQKGLSDNKGYEPPSPVQYKPETSLPFDFKSLSISEPKPKRTSSVGSFLDKFHSQLRQERNISKFEKVREPELVLRTTKKDTRKSPYKSLDTSSPWSQQKNT